MPPSPNLPSMSPAAPAAAAAANPTLHDLPDKILTDLMILMEHEALMNFIRTDKANHKHFKANKDHIFRERIRKEFCAESSEDVYDLLRALQKKQPSIVQELCLRNEGLKAKANDASGTKAAEMLSKYFAYIQTPESRFHSLPKNRRVRVMHEIYELMFHALTQHANPDHRFRHRNFLLTARAKMNKLNEEVAERPKPSPEVQKAWDDLYARMIYIFDREIAAFPAKPAKPATGA